MVWTRRSGAFATAIERRGDSMTASVIGLETAKNVFHVHGLDERGRVVLRKRLRRGQLTDFFANLPICIIGLEATQGAHY
jgi:transposase